MLQCQLNATYGPGLHLHGSYDADNLEAVELHKELRQIACAHRGRWKGHSTSAISDEQETPWRQSVEPLHAFYLSLAIDWSKKAPLEYLPKPSTCRFRLQVDVFAALLLDPTLPHHCLFECIGFGATGEYGNEQLVRDLRVLVSSLWHQSSPSVLGKDLAQTARCMQQSPRQYLRGIQRAQWGGYKEAVLLSRALGLSTRIWDPAGNLLLSVTSQSDAVSHLCYTGKHYMVVKPWKRQIWRARLCRWRANPICSVGRGGMHQDKNNESSVKYRIVQKLVKESVSDAQALVNLLWDKDNAGVRAIRGSLKEVKENIMKLASDLQVSHYQGTWQQFGAPGEDKLQQSDPWGKWYENRSDGSGSNGKLSKTQICRNPGGKGCGFIPLLNRCPTGVPGKAMQA